jgi:hypothetical protein
MEVATQAFDSLAAKQGALLENLFKKKWQDLSMSP